MSDVGSANGRTRGRQLWFQFHKWIGLILLVVLIPVSASGSLLVWHDWTDGLVNPQRYAVKDAPAALAPAAYADAARTVLKPDDRIASIEFPHQPGSPVLVTASMAPTSGASAPSGPAARYQVWLDPADARVTDHADAREGVLRFLHVFHGSMMIPGWGRTIVGWLGVAMLISCLTGLWLWMPTIGSLARGLRWKRSPLTSANLHHQVGFWIAVPLAILSFTGAYISFPTAMRSVEGLFASGARPAPGGGGGGGARVRPAEVTRLSADQAVASAKAGTGDAQTALIRWPTEKDAEWTVALESAQGRNEIKVDDATGEVSKGRAPPAGFARVMRTLHDGNGYNGVWQTIIFLGGLAPALLGITGLIMWLRTRVWRGKVADRLARSSGPASDAA